MRKSARLSHGARESSGREKTNAKCSACRTRQALSGSHGGRREIPQEGGFHTATLAHEHAKSCSGRGGYRGRRWGDCSRGDEHGQGRVEGKSTEQGRGG